MQTKKLFHCLPFRNSYNGCLKSHKDKRFKDHLKTQKINEKFITYLCFLD